MKTIEVNAFEFHELSEEVQINCVTKLSFLFAYSEPIPMYDVCRSIYVKLESFDLASDRVNIELDTHTGVFDVIEAINDLVKTGPVFEAAQRYDAIFEAAFNLHDEDAYGDFEDTPFYRIQRSAFEESLGDAFLPAIKEQVLEILASECRKKKLLFLGDGYRLNYDDLDI